MVAVAGLLGTGWGQTCDVDLGGKGTAANPFEIADSTEFTAMTGRFSELTDAGSTTDACWSASFALTSDVDLENALFIPVGLDNNYDRNGDAWFRGTFDGRGHTIKNFHFDVYDDTPDAALFAGLDGATVRDVIFKNASVASESYRVGVVAGDAKDATFENVNVLASRVQGGTGVGLLAGRASGGAFIDVRVRRSSVSVTDTSETNTTAKGGGLAGSLDVTSDVLVRNPDVKIDVDGGRKTGGLFGQVEGNAEGPFTLTVADGEVSGVVRGERNTGGLIGRLRGTASLVVDDGPVNVDVMPSAALSGDLQQAGGIVGKAQGTARIEGVQLFGDVGDAAGTGRYVGGVVGIVEGDEADVTVRGLERQGGEMTGGNNVGGVIGRVERGAATLDGVTVFGADVSGDQGVGGVVGAVSARTILRDVRFVPVEGQGGTVKARRRVGGLVGRLIAADLTATTVLVVGKVRATASNENADAGGLVGEMQNRQTGDPPTLTVEGMYSLADVTSTNGQSDVAGVVGRAAPGSAITIRDVRVDGAMEGEKHVAGFVGRLQAFDGVSATLEVRRGLLVGSVTDSGGVGAPVVGRIGASDPADAVLGVEAFVPADVYGSPVRGTPLGAAERTDPRTFLDAGWSLVNGPEGSGVWRMCAGQAWPFLAEGDAPEGCAAVDLAEGLGVGVSSRSLLRGVPFDVVVSVVDAEGVAFPAATAGSVELRGEGGAEPGVLRFASEVDGGAPVVDVVAGVERVTFTDVVYTGLSDVSGGDVVLTAVGGGGLDGLRGASSGVSVRDVGTTVEIDRDAVVADGVDRATVTVTVQRADGSPIEGKSVTLRTTVGSFVVGGRSVGASVDRVTDSEGVVAVGLSSAGSVGTAEVSVSCAGACDVGASVDFVEASMPFTVVPGNGVAWVYPGFGDAVEGVEVRVGLEGEAGSVLSSSDVRGPVRVEGLENGVAYGVEVDALGGAGEVLETRSGMVTPGVVVPPVLRVSVDRDVAPGVESVEGGTLVTVRMRVEHEESGPLERAWFVVEVPEDVSVVRAKNVSRGSVAPERVAWRWVGDAWPAGEVLSFDVTFRVVP